MDLAKEIEELAMNFEACRKALSAMGDETRQYIILEMMLPPQGRSRFSIG